MYTEPRSQFLSIYETINTKGLRSLNMYTEPRSQFLSIYETINTKGLRSLNMYTASRSQLLSTCDGKGNEPRTISSSTMNR